MGELYHLLFTGGVDVCVYIYTCMIMYVPGSPRPNKECGFGVIHGSQRFPILPMQAFGPDRRLPG